MVRHVLIEEAYLQNQNKKKKEEVYRYLYRQYMYMYKYMSVEYDRSGKCVVLNRTVVYSD